MAGLPRPSPGVFSCFRPASSSLWPEEECRAFVAVPSPPSPFCEPSPAPSRDGRDCWNFSLWGRTWGLHSSGRPRHPPVRPQIRLFPAFCSAWNSKAAAWLRRIPGSCRLRNMLLSMTRRGFPQQLHHDFPGSLRPVRRCRGLARVTGGGTLFHEFRNTRLKACLDKGGHLPPEFLRFPRNGGNHGGSPAVPEPVQSQYFLWDSPRDFNCSAVTERPSFRSDKKRPSMVAVSF